MLVDERGKSVVHFRRKSNDEMARLYDALAKFAPEGAAETSTEGAPLFSEDAEAVLAPMKAWAERKRAEHEEKQRAKRDAERPSSGGLSTSSALGGTPSPPHAQSPRGLSPREKFRGVWAVLAAKMRSYGRRQPVEADRLARRRADVEL